MNELKKSRVKAVFKYTWPFYIISAILTVFLMDFIFRLNNKTPKYQTLTLFVSGEVTNRDSLEKDLMEKYKEKDLKLFSCIDSMPNSFNYDTKLSVTGYNSADVLIIPSTKLSSINISAFGLELDETLTNYYSSCTFYSQKGVNYGVKIDKEKVSKYITLPGEECYMVLNAISENLGEHSKDKIKEHDNALTLVKDWASNV